MRLRPVIALVLVVFVGPGCAKAPNRAAVVGTVNVDGLPLERGVINFFPVEGTRGPGAGGAISNGEFTLDERTGPVIGTNRVEIRGFRKTGKSISLAGVSSPEEIQIVPPQFNDKSKEVRTIERGSNTLHFDIPGAGK